MDLMQAGKWKELERLFHAFPDLVDQTDVYEMTPLHWLCTDPDAPKSLFSALITHGLETLKQENVAGWIPLHIAVKAKLNATLVQLLLEAYPASIARETRDGDHAIALAKKTHATQDVLEVLMKSWEALHGLPGLESNSAKVLSWDESNQLNDSLHKKVAYATSYRDQPAKAAVNVKGHAGFDARCLPLWLQAVCR